LTIEKRRVDEALFAARERAEVTLNSIGDAVLSTDLDGHVTYLNSAAEAMTGWPREEAIGQSIADVFHIIDRETRERARDPLSLAIALNKTVGLTPNCLLVRRDGHETEIEDSAAPIQGADGQVTGAVIVFRDVGAALETSRQMSHLAQHDALTGLPNRLLLNDRLTAAIAAGHRRNKPLAVLFLDVDGFKGINDSLGHAAGDQLLRLMATRLSGSLRQSDTVSRFGGDEFVVILPEIEHAEDVTLVARKLLQVIASLHRVDAQSVTVTASIGITLYPDHGQDADSLITNADAAMYDAKRSGLGNYRIFDPGMNARARERRALERGLREAIERGDLVLHYQPQVDLASGATIGVEALLRWSHPERGLLPAAQFIPLAEECGLAVPLGQWTIREACRQARAWQDAGLGALRSAVNLSATEFWRRGFLDDVQASLREMALDASHLEFELTENILMEDPISAATTLRALKHIGACLAIDHFGTGHSSLSDLLRFPIDVLKVDQSFVAPVAAGATGAPGLTAIIGLGKSLNCRVRATGIETEAQLAILRAQECPEAQGYLFGSPAGPEALAERLGLTRGPLRAEPVHRSPRA
jgi:diguanylate cyclase (GGDEF)-like protein/PAS domain S-box-containing protein